MKRFHDQGSTRKRQRRKRDALLVLPKAEREDPDCWANQQHWNKRHPHDCGNAQCPICRSPRYRDQPRTKRHPIHEEGIP